MSDDAQQTLSEAARTTIEMTDPGFINWTVFDQDEVWIDGQGYTHDIKDMDARLQGQRRSLPDAGCGDVLRLLRGGLREAEDLQRNSVDSRPGGLDAPDQALQGSYVVRPLPTESQESRGERLRRLVTKPLGELTDAEVFEVEAWMKTKECEDWLQTGMIEGIPTGPPTRQV